MSVVRKKLEISLTQKCLLFCYFFLLLLTRLSFGSKLQKCEGINYSGNVTTNSEELFSYNFNLAVSYEPKINETFPNKISFENFTWKSSNAFGYEPTFPVSVYFGISPDSINCDLQNNDCEFIFPNGIIHFYINIQNDTDSASIITIPDVVSFFIENGYIFSGSDGSFLNTENSCRYGVHSVKNVTFSQEACCVAFEDIEINEPDSSDSCTEFQTNAFISDTLKDIEIYLNVLYSVISVTDTEKLISMHFKILNSTLPSSMVFTHYMFGVNSELNQCQGGLNNLQNSFCNLRYIMINDIKQFDMVFTLQFQENNETLIMYPEIIIGHLLSINGKFYKTLNSSFTNKNRCWYQNANYQNDQSPSNVPFSTANYVASFCCTKFEDQSVSSTSIQVHHKNFTSASTVESVSTTTFTVTTTSTGSFIQIFYLKLLVLFMCLFNL